MISLEDQVRKLKTDLENASKQQQQQQQQQQKGSLGSNSNAISSNPNSNSNSNSNSANISNEIDEMRKKHVEDIRRYQALLQKAERQNIDLSREKGELQSKLKSATASLSSNT